MTGLKGFFFFITVAAISTAATFLPRLFEMLVYKRNLLLAGEIWRLVTCHFVHFSLDHLIYDLIGFLIALILLREEKMGQITLLLGWNLIYFGIAVVAIEPQMIAYGGLSGIVSGMLTYAAMQMCTKAGTSKVTGIGILILLSADLFYILETEKGLFVSFNTGQVISSSTVHVAGMVAGLFVYLKQKIQPSASPV